MLEQEWDIHNPGSVKAVSVLSSGNYIDPSSGAQGIPFQVIIGDADDPEAVETSQMFARDLQASGSEVDYWLLPGVGHQMTDTARKMTIDFFREQYEK